MTPVVYLYLNRLKTFPRRKRRNPSKQDAAPSPLKLMCRIGGSETQFQSERSLSSRNSKRVFLHAPCLGSEMKYKIAS